MFARLHVRTLTGNYSTSCEAGRQGVGVDTCEVFGRDGERGIIAADGAGHRRAEDAVEMAVQLGFRKRLKVHNALCSPLLRRNDADAECPRSAVGGERHTDLDDGDGVHRKTGLGSQGSG